MEGGGRDNEPLTQVCGKIGSKIYPQIGDRNVKPNMQRNCVWSASRQYPTSKEEGKKYFEPLQWVIVKAFEKNLCMMFFYPQFRKIWVPKLNSVFQNW